MKTAAILASLALAVLCRPAASEEWSTFVEPHFGTKIELPKDVFSIHEGASYRGIGEQYKTKDARAALAVYSQENVRHETPRTYLSRNSQVPRRAIDFLRVTPSFFAVSAVKEGMIFYSRCNFSRRASTIHCFDLKYPVSEKRAWDDIVTRMSRSLEPLERG